MLRIPYTCVRTHPEAGKERSMLIKITPDPSRKYQIYHTELEVEVPDHIAQDFFRVREEFAIAKQRLENEVGYGNLTFNSVDKVDP